MRIVCIILVLINIAAYFTGKHRGQQETIAMFQEKFPLGNYTDQKAYPGLIMLHGDSTYSVFCEDGWKHYEPCK